MKSRVHLKSWHVGIDSQLLNSLLYTARYSCTFFAAITDSIATACDTFFVIHASFCCLLFFADCRHCWRSSTGGQINRVSLSITKIIMQHSVGFNLLNIEHSISEQVFWTVRDLEKYLLKLYSHCIVPLCVCASIHGQWWFDFPSVTHFAQMPAIFICFWLFVSSLCWYPLESDLFSSGCIGSIQPGCLYAMNFKW